MNSKDWKNKTRTRIKTATKYLPDVRDIRRNVVLRAWIEVVLGSQNRRLRARVLFLQPVPVAIVFLSVDEAAENVPSPPVHRDAERQQH